MTRALFFGLYAIIFGIVSSVCEKHSASETPQENAVSSPENTEH